MLKTILTAFFLAVLPSLCLADSQWALQESTLTYHASHPLHQVEGLSHAARGKGLCHQGQCDFLIAVPVKSFDSGSNRNLHMVPVTRDAEFPMVVVRTRFAIDDAGQERLRGLCPDPGTRRLAGH